MAITNLGTNAVNDLYQYVPYDAIALVEGNTYTFALRFLNTQPELLYSKFRIEFRHDSPLPGNFTQIYPFDIFYSELIQTLDFRFTPNIPISGTVVPRIVRLPTYSRPTTTSDVDIRLLVDPAVFY